MEIKKRSIITKANVHVATVIIQFERFKPVPLYLEESSYFGILKPIINEIFGADYIPIYSPTAKPADLRKSLEVPHQHLGFPRVFSWPQTKKSIVTNSSYFLLNPEELPTPFDRLGQHIGLMLIENTIIIPPLYPRPALCLTPSGPTILKPSISDLTLRLPGGFPLGRYGKSEDMRSALLCFGNDTLDSTVKVAKHERLLAISGDTIVEDKTMGKVWVPRTGILVRLAGNDRNALRQNTTGQKVNFEIEGLMDSKHAIQCGPLLVENGEIVDLKQELLDEQFSLDNGFRLPPSRFPIDTDITRAARFAIGITKDNKFVAVLVEGGSSKVRKGIKSKTGGMTLLELAQLMVSLEVQTAMNFDGGGSVQGFFSGGGALVQSGEKYCSFQAQFDRPVPYGLVLE
jgi:hypothetical protein